MNYKAVILDFDGTLSDSKKNMIYCIQESFTRNQLDAPEESKILNVLKLGLIPAETFKLLSKVNITNQIANEIAETYDFLESTVEEKSNLYPNAINLLSRLHHACVHTIIVSNKVASSIIDDLNYFKVKPYVSFVFDCAATNLRKPDISIYNKHIKLQIGNISEKKLLVVGDTETDVKFANNIGADCCFVSHGYGSYSKNFSVQYVSNDLYEVEKIIFDDKSS